MQRNDPLTISLNNLSLFAEYEKIFQQSGGPIAPHFVEVLWDNYCHLHPEQIQEYLRPFAPRVALHVMHSRYLSCSEEKLSVYFKHLANHVNFLRPTYVSDHIGNFFIDEIHLLTPAEHDYIVTPRLVERIKRYQEAIGQQLLLENYASTESAGTRQVDFFEEIIDRTQCGILFDVSNAAIAQANNILPAEAWHSLLAGRRLHAHIGGYSRGSTTGLFHDSHNAPISRLSLDIIKSVAAVSSFSSVCIERDYNFTAESVIEDIRIVASALETQNA